MKKNLIKKLADKSYSRGNLDVGKISKIASILKRDELKVYIRSIKTLEAKKTVVVTVSNESDTDELKNHFVKLFPNKKITIQVDESLLSGIRIVDYDNVYELSLKDILEHGILGGKDD